MLKRRLIPKTEPSSSSAKADPKLGKLAAKSRSQVQEPEEDEEPEDEEDEEESPEERAKVRRRVDRPVKKKGSLAAAFKNVSLNNNAQDIPAGNHEAIISEFVLQAPDSKGQSARLKFELCDPDFAGKNTLTTWFKLLEANLQDPCEGGMRAFKMAFAKLGYEADGIEEVEEALEEINDEKPGVLIKVGYEGEKSDGTPWVRVRIEDVCDTDIIAAYKDNIPY